MSILSRKASDLWLPWPESGRQIGKWLRAEKKDDLIRIFSWCGTSVQLGVRVSDPWSRSASGVLNQA